MAATLVRCLLAVTACLPRIAAEDSRKELRRVAVLTLADAEAQLEARSYQGSWLSQAGQDRWAALYALRGTPPPEENEKARSAWPQRWFVEVGAADGIELSNSAALERLGWRGVCIEASPSSVARLRTNRPGCITVDAVVGRTAGEKVTFTSYEGADRFFSGVASHEYFNAFGDESRGKTFFVNRSGAAGTSVERVTATLAGILDAAGAPRHVDFLSLDCEGLELDVLETFPWHERSFGAITVDNGHVSSKRRKVESLLARRGYVRSSCHDHDDAFVPAASLIGLEEAGGAASAAAHAALLAAGGASPPAGPWAGEAVLADLATCESTVLSVRCGADGATFAMDPPQREAAAAVCRAAELDDEGCTSVLGATVARLCTPHASLSFPFASGQDSAGHFTLVHLPVTFGSTVVRISLPLLPSRRARALAVGAVGQAFCRRAGGDGAVCDELVAFLQQGLEGWVTAEQDRALQKAADLLGGD